MTYQLQKKTIDHKYKPKKLFLDAYSHKSRCKNEVFTVKEESTYE